MKVGRYEVGSNPPDLIGYLLGKAIASDAEDEDRLLVLKAANHVDGKGKSSYGRVVLKKLIRDTSKPRSQAPNFTEPVKAMFTTDRDVSEAVKEISKALDKSCPILTLFDVRGSNDDTYDYWSNEAADKMEKIKAFEEISLPNGNITNLDDLGNPRIIVIAEGMVKEIVEFNHALNAVVGEI